jgi:hypothetical protein
MTKRFCDSCGSPVQQRTETYTLYTRKTSDQISWRVSLEIRKYDGHTSGTFPPTCDLCDPCRNRIIREAINADEQQEETLRQHRMEREARMKRAEGIGSES